MVPRYYPARRFVIPVTIDKISYYRFCLARWMAASLRLDLNRLCNMYVNAHFGEDKNPGAPATWF